MTGHFAFLRQNICLESTDAPINWLTGTSYATAVVAGVAARLLHFSRHPGGDRYVAQNLQSFTGIKAVLNYLAQGSGDNNYKCVRPWRFTDSAQPSDSQEDLRQSIHRQLAVVLQAVLR
jgi:hypothetical protein